MRNFSFCWNHKFLDYEIETDNVIGIRISLPCWNHKFLDYEIETVPVYLQSKNPQVQVGIISFSITRLKQVLAR